MTETSELAFDPATDSRLPDSAYPPTAYTNSTDHVVEMLGASRSARRARWLAVVAAFVVGAGVGAISWSSWDTNRSKVESVETAATNLSTVAAEQMDLVTYVDYDGNLGYSTSEDVLSVTGGTITAIPAAGIDLVRGSLLYAVDTVPVTLFYGSVPGWRDLDIYAEDGRDITQLEANLWELGYTVDLDDGFGPRLTVDGNFDWATAYSVELWETDLGLDDPDGTFELGRVTYLPGDIRVDNPIALGSAANPGAVLLTATVTMEVTDVIDLIGPEAATVSGAERVATERVSVEVATAEQDSFELGGQVLIELADGTEASGIVTEKAEVPRRVAQGAGGLVIDVTIEIIDVPDVVEGPVTVRVVDQAARGTTAVPVRALVALAEGGYAVQISAADGDRLIVVETGAFADGFVQVTGELAPGDLVVVPS